MSNVKTNSVRYETPCKNGCGRLWIRLSPTQTGQFSEPEWIRCGACGDINKAPMKQPTDE
jgi:hypothetical protein